MHVGLIGNKAGIPTYIEKLVEQINKLDNKKIEYILYSNKEINIDLELRENVIVKHNMSPKMIGTLWLYFRLPKILNYDKIDVFFGTQHCLPARNEYTEKIKFVVTIHDLAIKKLKTVGSLGNTIIQKLFVKSSLKNADKIIAISKATKRDVVELYKINEDKIQVVYNGANVEKNEVLVKQEEEIKEKLKINDAPYICFLSTIEPRKNVETLIRAFEFIKERENTGLKLILAGGLGWKYNDVLNLFEGSKYKEDIIMPGYISKEEKKYLYENTKCFVYPSLYEGFGMPILEAMANKSLVITANNSSLPEVGGDVAFYYQNATDYKELGNKILEVINIKNEEKQERIDKGLEQIKRFSWKKCADETLGILKK